MKYIKSILAGILGTCLAMNVQAQEIPIVISGGTIHLGNGKLIQSGTIVLNRGKVMEVGDAPVSFIKNAKTIDATGKHIYPGIIALNNIMGLNEIDAVRATRDFNETGDMNPNVRALIAYNTDSKILPTATFNGILFTQCVPQGGNISGTSSLVYTKAWNWEDAAVKADDGVHLNYADLRVARRAEDKENQQKELDNIRHFFEDAAQYAKLENPEPVNQRLKAMKSVMEGKTNLYVHVNHSKGLVSAIQFFKENYPQIKMVLVGADDAYKISDLIAQHKIPVILGNVHRLPSHASEDFDQPYKTATQLVEKGILVAISQAGSWESRNVIFNAGTCAAYGLTKEQALQLVTENAAKIVGIDNRIGTLEKGKDASLVISDGDLLDMKTSNVIQAFIMGEEIDLRNQQVELYEKYKKKFGID